MTVALPLLMVDVVVAVSLDKRSLSDTNGLSIVRLVVDADEVVGSLCSS